MSKKVHLMDISIAVQSQNVHKTLRTIKQSIKKGWRQAPAFNFSNYSFTTLAACGPRFPSTISKETS
jgi:hypothetical protein